MKRCVGLLKEEELLLAASHVHTSPNTDSSKRAFSDISQEYVSSVENAVADAIFELLTNAAWTEVHVRFSERSAKYSIHRRRKGWNLGRRGLHREVTFAPNPQGPTDEGVRVMTIETIEGNLIGVLWGISCHPVAWPKPEEISSDFPGGVREEIRAAAGAHLPVLFFQGFCGDLRPPATGYWSRNWDWRRKLLALFGALLQEASFVPFSQKEYCKWLTFINLVVGDTFEDCLNSEPLDPNLKSRISHIPLSSLGLEGEISSMLCQILLLSKRFVFVAIGAEICWEYYEMLSNIFPGSKVWPVGYADAVYGYLPTSAMLDEGGYEVSGFMRQFQIRGVFPPDLDRIVCQQFELMRSSAEE
jgi:hypothetical protein